MDKKFKTIILGGTFDHLHIGHKDFILHGTSLAYKAIICLTSNNYVKENKGENFEDYETRKKALEEFLEQQKLAGKVQIAKIDDAYGIALDKNAEIDAIAVVEKTIKGAESINIKREELGLPPLEVVVVTSTAADNGSVMSSSAIRSGEMNRNGRSYLNPKWLRERLILPENLREELKNPFGELVEDDKLTDVGNPVITVGDIITEKFNKLSLNHKISVIDFNVARKKKFSNISDLGFPKDTEVIIVENQAGQISPELFQAIVSAFSKPGKVIVEVLGEEDLAVLPATLTAPLGSTIFYGQPGLGVVRIIVTEEFKEKAYRLLTEFKISS